MTYFLILSPECQSLFAEGGVSAVTDSFDTLYNVLQ